MIVLTGHDSLDVGVRAIQLGAANFLQKPPIIPHLVALITDGFRQAEIRAALKIAEGSRDSVILEESVIGVSPVAEKLREDLRFAAHTEQPVLLLGETGTGKGLCARMIHRLSGRHKSQLVRFQPGLSGADLIGSELFGHIRGAFTGADQDRTGLVELANQGTLFLDEIDELPSSTQVSLLGLLQEGTFRPLGSSKDLKASFRLISATNAPIAKAVESEKLRSDLYHRIAHLEIKIPPLRERKADIEPIAESVLERMPDVSGVVLGDAFRSELLKHEWPGNVRELEAVVERAAYRADFAGRSEILVEDSGLNHKDASALNETGSLKEVGFQKKVQELKLKLIHDALESTGGNQLQAAKKLGIDRSTLRRILEV